ncbi:hypothetical protein [Dyadobacter sandarakinus]|uniref:Lipoprotein n=1 Tax=Dyadobacter sandarakinus TaxID=2747268 RepID=A0ABX7I3Z9_9BACT|nr:hypothetical protein [Dyadobacter sandarakinus]QRR00237.1 hypothetical protein HWI92_04625 [Dyadobacter sandarakinus]
MMMKTSLLRFPPVFLFLLLSLWMAGCERNVDCQAPPPSFAFRIVSSGDTYPAPADTSGAVRISYQDGGKQKYIHDVRVMNGSFETAEMIWQSRALNDPEFTFEFEDQPFTKIRLQTYINHARCQGWATISAVYQNGSTIDRGNDWFYLLSEK